MRDVKIDSDGALRCWNCGGKNFDSKRTGRSKLLVGVGTLATKRKLKCQVCGEYNQTGNAKPYSAPASRKYRKAEAKRTPATPPPAAPSPTPPPVQAGPPPGWYNDPHGAAVQRWWDGTTWTDHTQPVPPPG
jgi:hypothetical protein